MFLSPFAKYKNDEVKETDSTCMKEPINAYKVLLAKQYGKRTPG
jgi:hypothetical protein